MSYSFIRVLKSINKMHVVARQDLYTVSNLQVQLDIQYLNRKQVHFSFAVSIVLFTLLIAIIQQAISPFGTAVTAKLFSDSAFCHWSTDQHGPQPEHMLLFQASQHQSIKGNQVLQKCFTLYQLLFLLLLLYT